MAQFHADSKIRFAIPEPIGGMFEGELKESNKRPFARFELIGDLLGLQRIVSGTIDIPSICGKIVACKCAIEYPTGKITARAFSIGAFTIEGVRFNSECNSTR